MKPLQYIISLSIILGLMVHVLTDKELSQKEKIDYLLMLILILVFQIVFLYVI